MNRSPSITEPGQLRMTATRLEYFWSRIAWGGKQECWPWTGGSTGWGYGSMSVGGRQVGSHRIAYILQRGPIPHGLHVLHRCDNPPCCNPDHLFLGTPAANNADRDAKGRQRSRKGEDSPQSKLTARQVIDIWTSDEPELRLALKYGISTGTVSNIRCGYTWRSVTGGRRG